MNGTELINFAAQLNSVNLTELSRQYAAYSYDYDCRMAAKELDGKISALAKAGSLTTAQAGDILAIFKAYESGNDTFRYFTQSSLLKTLFSKATQHLNGIATAWDNKASKLLGEEHTLDWCNRVCGLYAEYNALDGAVKQRCKQFEALNRIYVDIGHVEYVLNKEKEIDSLNAEHRDWGWCDRVDALWGTAVCDSLSRCRNFELLKQLKGAADHRRLEIECQEYTAALANTAPFEKVLELDKNKSAHLSSLRKLIDNFDNRWQDCVKDARRRADEQAEKWFQEAWENSGTRQFELFKRAAELGHHRAAWEVAYSICYGRSVEKSDEQALKWLEIADAHGNLEAPYLLGWRYYYGNCGCSQDYNKAFTYFQRGANFANDYWGKNDCVYYLGCCYYYGFGTSMNKSIAFSLFKQSADMKSALAMYMLGVCYENGEGTSRSEDTALEWYDKGAAAGESRAKVSAARIRGARQELQHRLERERLERERKEAEKRRKAELNAAIDTCYASAVKGDANSMFQLGEYYYTGNGVTRSYGDAFIWFEKAAKKGNKKAMERLGDCYYNGYGVEKSFAKAEKWYKKSSK